jgi:hypothetical protein
VAELYWGTTADFVEVTKHNQIAERLKQAFFDYHGWTPPESEVRSWRNSLRALSNAIELGGFLPMPVTIIGYSVEQLGRRAAELLFRRIRGYRGPRQTNVIRTSITTRGRRPGIKGSAPSVRSS